MTAMVRAVRLTGAEKFWYVLQCIGFGAGYFAKVPAKKALEEAGLAQMTGAERFWYALQCIAFGSGYFAKLPIKKALSEMRAAPVPAGSHRLDYGQQQQQIPPGYGQQDRGIPADPPQELPRGQRYTGYGDGTQQGRY